MNCRGRFLLASLLFCLSLRLFGLPESRDRAFHQMSLPGFAFDYWKSIGGSDSGSMSLSYRHCVVSSFYGYSDEPRLLERSRWEVYVRAGILEPMDPASFEPGAYSALGWTVSFESPGSVFRRVFIPYAGIELGMLTESSDHGGDLSFSAAFASSALLGVHLFSGPAFNCSVESAFVQTLLRSEPLKVRIGLTCSFAL